MGGKKSLKVKELHDSIKVLTTYKCQSKDVKTKLEALIKTKIEEKAKAVKDGVADAQEFNIDKNKDFTDAIFGLNNNLFKDDKYIKYDMMDEFYDNSVSYQKIARNLVKLGSKGEASTVDSNINSINEGKDKARPNIQQFEIGNEGEFKEEDSGFEDDDTDDKNKKIALANRKRPVLDKGKEESKIQGIFSNIGGADGPKIVDANANTEKDLLEKIRDIDFSKMKQQFDESKDDSASPIKRSGTIIIPPEDKKLLNQMVSNFMKNFKKISDKKVVVSSVRTMREFMFENNGSKKIQELKGKANNEQNIDLVIFKKESDRPGMALKFGTEEEMYVWLFVKLEVESFTVRINLLEKMIQTTTKKNVENKADEVILDLNNVYKEILGMIDSNDPNKSINAGWYGGKMKDGIRINKGSVEELIHVIKTFQDDPANKGKLMNSFTKHKDETNNINLKQLQAVLDTVKIENNPKQAEHLFKLIDVDKNRVISKDEFDTYLKTYNVKEPLSTNILQQAKGENKLEIFQDILDVKLRLSSDDYFFDDITTILNSDFAALTR